MYQFLKTTLMTITLQNFWCNAGFFSKENLRYPIWTCRDPISLILGTRFSLILGTRIGSLKRLKKPWCNVLHQGVSNSNYSEGRSLKLTQQWRYVNLTRNSLYILFPAKHVMSY